MAVGRNRVTVTHDPAMPRRIQLSDITAERKDQPTGHRQLDIDTERDIDMNIHEYMFILYEWYQLET